MFPIVRILLIILIERVRCGAKLSKEAVFPVTVIFHTNRNITFFVDVHFKWAVGVGGKDLIVKLM